MIGNAVSMARDSGRCSHEMLHIIFPKPLKLRMLTPFTDEGTEAQSLCYSSRSQSTCSHRTEFEDQAWKAMNVGAFPVYPAA